MALIKKFEKKYELKISQLPEDVIKKLKEAHHNVSAAIIGEYNKAHDKDLTDFVKKFISALSTGTKNVELYKIKSITGYRFECMIQLMKHFELPSDKKLANKIHSFVKKVFNFVKPLVNKHLSYKLDNENDSGRESFEGFDIYPDSKTCKRIYDELMKTKVITEGIIKDVVDTINPFKSDINSNKISDAIKSKGDQIAKAINKHADKTFKGLKNIHKDLEKQAKSLAKKAPTKKVNESIKKLQLVGQKILNEQKLEPFQTTIIKNELIDLFLKNTKLGNSISPLKFKLTIDDKKDISYLELNVANFSNESLSKIFNSHLNLYDFILESNFSMKISTALLLSIKDPNDIYTFFNFVFTVYIQKTLKKICDSIQKNFVNLNTTTKELLSESDMKSIFLLIIHQCLVFTNISLTDLSGISDNLQNVQKTMQWCFDMMANLNKNNKKSIMAEINKTLKEYKEHIDLYSDIYSSIIKLDTILESYMNGKYDYIIEDNKEQLLHRSVNHADPEDYQTRVLVEKYNLLRLKKIDKSILGEYKTLAENTLNPLGLASEMIPLMEQVDWYIELLDKNSSQYIIPQSQPELESIQSELKNIYKSLLGINSDKNIKINGFKF